MEQSPGDVTDLLRKIRGGQAGLDGHHDCLYGADLLVGHARVLGHAKLLDHSRPAARR